MIKDIQIMIELQRYWDNVLRQKGDIEKSEKSISFWKKQAEDKLKEISFQENKIKEQKISAKQKEIDLTEKEEQFGKLDKRKNIIKNEKEMTALEHEITKLSSDKDILENQLIELFDTISQSESRLAGLKSESAEVRKQASEDIKGLEERISSFKLLIDENQQKFDGLKDQLSPEVKSRFLKLTKSHNGKAIAALAGENCSACNFQIPFNLIQDVEKEKNIVSCTNCGRFLYK